MDYRVEMTSAEAELQGTLEISSFNLQTEKNAFHSFSVVTSLILPEARFQVAPTEWSSSQQEEALPLGPHIPLGWLSPIVHLSLLETSASSSCQPCTVGQQFGPLRFSPFRIKCALVFQSFLIHHGFQTHWDAPSPSLLLATSLILQCPWELGSMYAQQLHSVPSRPYRWVFLSVWLATYP